MINNIWILIGKKLSGEATAEELAELEELLRQGGTDLYPVDLLENLWREENKIKADDKLEAKWAAFEDKLDVADKAVIVFTGWSKHWNTDAYFENHPHLTAEAAQYLKDQEVKLVGIDSHNIDNTAGNSRPVHTILLGANILIVEHLCNLDKLPPEGYKFNAVPPKFKGVGTFPVRAYAMVGG